jgi:anti-sigma regulatory factor (Ser/Thr protein kinase)
MRSWLRGTSLALAPLPGAVPCSRLHVRLVLAEWGLPHLAADAELLVSELVSNAISHGSRGGGDHIRVSLRSDGTQVCLLVWDQNLTLPTPAEPDTGTPDGRGLMIVAALAARWGSYRTQDGGGKIVWAVLA